MHYREFLERSAFDRGELLALAQGNLVSDPPPEFIRLPAPPMLMLDRVVELTRKGAQGRVVAERDVHLDDWFFLCHFRGDPVQPGCLGLDAIWQLVGLFCAVSGARGSGRALGCKEVEFAGQIRPHDRIVRYEVDIRRFATLKDSGASIAIGTARVLVDGQPIYFVRDAKVGTFTGIQYPEYPAPSKNGIGGPMDRGEATPC